MAIAVFVTVRGTMFGQLRPDINYVSVRCDFVLSSKTRSMLDVPLFLFRFSFPLSFSVDGAVGSFRLDKFCFRLDLSPSIPTSSYESERLFTVSVPS